MISGVDVDLVRINSMRVVILFLSDVFICVVYFIGLGIRFLLWFLFFIG